MQGMASEARREAYAADVTYVTNSELGFDYLRDNLAQQPDDLVLKRAFSFCIIDEVDSILIDEARTPLIISGQAEKPSERCALMISVRRGQAGAVVSRRRLLACCVWRGRCSCTFLGTRELHANGARLRHTA